MNRLTKMATASGVALGLILGTGITAAHAEEAPDSAEAVFEEFLDTLKVDAKTDAALTERFDDLPPAEQKRVADAIEEDPLSVMVFDAGAPTLTSGTGTSAQPALARNSARGLHIRTSAAAPRYTATYPVNASLFGITTGTFTMRYVFEATSTNVTRNLECTGWFTGAAGVWNIGTSQSNYVSGGQGACTVKYTMSLAFKGSFFTANKQQQLVYKGTRLTSTSLKNI
ncbi:MULTISPECIES: hypothetical protein [unclassified Leifsonia]|uniref:hypothetical protein n=1 Tax=unclassified Leifsonia TaxID=2663824 RepID=UPI00036419F0|nr:MULTISPECIES: hypothetical protein [unclassified Leifsonia]TDP99435.1 hypothetical protein AXZ95_3354 [Leifsonia sp. 115AMFTsu3.1]